MSSIPISGSRPVYQDANVKCSLNAVPSSADSYIICEVEGADVPERLSSSGIRPRYCDERRPDIKWKTECLYEYVGMKRCGCPALDPKNYPELWEAYSNSVKEVVLREVNSGNKNITLTFFASGSLLQNCMTLNELFQLKELSEWEGTFNLQFVDFEYKVDSTRVQSSNSPKDEGASGMLIAAVVCMVLAICFFVKGAKQQGAKRNVFFAMGGAGVLSSIALFMSSNFQLQKTLESHQINRLPIDNPTTRFAMLSFLKILNEMMPKGIQANPIFFPSNEACVQAGLKSDAVLCYDGGGETDAFDTLRKGILKETGEAILVDLDGFQFFSRTGLWDPIQRRPFYAKVT